MNGVSCADLGRLKIGNFPGRERELRHVLSLTRPIARKTLGYTCAAFSGPTFGFSRVQIFLFLNDLAGRFSLFDGAARAFYVGAVPILAMIWIAQLCFGPLDFRENGWRRAKIVGATILAFFVAFLVVWLLDFLAFRLDLGVISPRPFMTRRVNWLVVEPQDNSFPCAETVLAAIFAASSWVTNRKIGVWSLGLAALLGLVRMVCGTNYLADVAFGLASGATIFALCLCVLRVSISRPNFGWQQWGISLAALLFLLGGLGFSLAATPRFAAKLGLNGQTPAAPRVADSTRSASAVLAGGEGAGVENFGADEAQDLALAKRSSLFLPDVEKWLRGELSPLTRPFSLLDVEVAPVKAGNSEYRCAALRFEIPRQSFDLRRQTAKIAAQLVSRAFALDQHLQNVDVTAITRGDAREIDGSQMIFTGDEVPVFTASIQRKNWISGANLPISDGEKWLESRSRLGINAQILPFVAPTPTPVPTATPKPHPTFFAQPTPIATPIFRATRKPIPTPKPILKFKPKPKPILKRQPIFKPKPVSTPKPIFKPTPRATIAPIFKPKTVATPQPIRIAPTPQKTGVLRP